MTPTTDEGWDALKRAVEDALELPTEARAAHLDARFPDAARRAQAARLLEGCERAACSPIFELPAAGFAAPLVAEVDRREPDLEALRAALAGRYTIEGELGRGGMATVYLARDERHGRSVALKLLRPELVPEGSPLGGAARFQREIEFAARLSHPHILPLYDSGETGGMLYYITPYVDGDTLRDRLRSGGRPPLDESLRLLRDVARALTHAHRQGVVHRDIKPSNILLSRDGDALVADFGVAKGLAAVQDLPGESEIDLTDGALVLGTPAYMAPEQVIGDPRIDHRADLYALGAVAYELLTGAPPFAGRPRHEQLAAHVSETPDPVATRRPDIPRSLAGLVDRLLAKSPGDRPRDAEEVLRRLNDAQAVGDAATPEGEAADGAPGTLRRWVSLVATLAILVVLWSSMPMGGKPAPGSGGDPTLAVLPFTNPSGSLDAAALGGALTDELVAALGSGPGVRIVTAASAAHLARWRDDPRGIGETLGVETLLQGSIGHDGETLRVAARHVRARDGRVLWSDTYDVPARDGFAAQARVAREITTAVSPRRSRTAPRASAGRGTEDPEAYRLYLKGRHLTNTRQRDGLFQGLSYLEQAVERDPAYARAHAGIADVWVFLGIFGHVPPHEAFPRARVAAERAVALDSLLVEGHATLAHVLFVYDWNWGAAESELLRAISLDPAYPHLRMYYASFLHSVGRSEEALEQLTTAQELDPLIATGVFSGRVYVDTGRPDAAIAVLAEEVGLEPRLDLGHQLLAHAYLQKGMGDEAIGSMQRAAALSGPRDSAQLAYVYAATGAQQQARDVLAGLLDGGRPLEPLGFHLAMAYGELGEADEAFRSLEAAYAQHASFMNLLGVSTGFESLRPDPRFDDMLRRMGLR